MSILIDFLLYFMYPPRCPVCGELNGDGVPCPECIDGLEKQKITGEICKKCGRNVNACSCKGKNYLFSGICAVYTNAGVARDSVYAIKYNDRPYAAEFFGRETGAVFAARFKNVKPDMVCAVPMSAASKRKRDHNHAALIAKAAAKELGLPYRDKALKKLRNNVAQHTLNAEQRRQNVKGVYKAYGNLTGKTVLLVDDICTTGATLNECAKQLRLAGAEKVYCAVVLVTEKGACKDETDLI